jgi:hypothetical protein
MSPPCRTDCRVHVADVVEGLSFRSEGCLEVRSPQHTTSRRSSSGTLPLHPPHLHETQSRGVFISPTANLCSFVQNKQQVARGDRQATNKGGASPPSPCHREAMARQGRRAVILPHRPPACKDRQTANKKVLWHKLESSARDEVMFVWATTSLCHHEQ